tara:strand:- start:360 stop:461 length:102 start_codon:yes stop_codon:yes gene_type:complete
MIDTSPSSIRLFAIMVMGLVWIYILNHPSKDDD